MKGDEFLCNIAWLSSGLVALCSIAGSATLNLNRQKQHYKHSLDADGRRSRQFSFKRCLIVPHLPPWKVFLNPFLELSIPLFSRLSIENEKAQSRHWSLRFTVYCSIRSAAMSMWPSIHAYMRAVRPSLSAASIGPWPCMTTPSLK